MTTLVLPIMFDLATDGTRVIPGPGTTYTLKQAAMEAVGTDTVVLFTAGESPHRRWQGVNMGRLCQTWLQHHYPDCVTAYEQADTFNTVGELGALVRYLRRTKHINMVTVVVKSWHAKRVRLIVNRLQQAGQLNLPICIQPHQYPWRIDMFNVGNMLREQIAFAKIYATYWP